jgi:Fur family zinc uptake transcriptional regulator
MQRSKKTHANAQAMAAQRGVALTESRRDVLDLVLAAKQPLTAYQLIELLREKRGKSVQPPTIYRALNFLIENEFVHRIESMNAFVACAEHEHVRNGGHDHLHATQFTICVKCGRTEELSDHKIAETLKKLAKTIGFEATQQMIELRGLCRLCRAS